MTNKNGLDSILDGLVVKSENWQALSLLSNLFQGKIQAIYIDPPFKTGKDFLYKDHYQDSSWLTLMDNRLNEALPFLKRNASMFVHLDWNANYLGRQLLRKEFGALTEIAWNTNATTDEEAGLFSFKSFGEKLVRQHDTIFQCSRNGDFKFIKLWKPNRRTSTLEIGWLDLISYPNKKPAQRLEDFDFFVETYNQSGQLSFEGVVIKEKVFPIGDIWNDIFSFTQSEMRTSENVSFDTQKPENLLRRILQLSTEKGDAVMDFFAGSGTTLAVAHKLQRKWVGVEMGDFFENTYFDEGEKKLGLLGRIKNVLKGDKEFKAIDKDRRSHLSKDINWKGGGFFKYQVLEQYDDSLENVEFDHKQIPEFTD